MPPGQAAKATENRAAGRGQAFGQLPPPAVARSPAGLAPGGCSHVIQCIVLCRGQCIGAGAGGV